MSVVINTNLDSTKIQNYLNSATADLSKTMQRMSSGLKVQSAKDDAAGCVISARMKVQLNGNQISQANVQNAKALLSTAEGNLDVVSENLSRIRDLTLQAKNGTYSEEEIKAMDDEVKERIEEINRISYSSKFSSLSLFNNGNTVETEATGIAKDGATFQTGANAGENNTIKAGSDLFKSVEFSAMSGIKYFSLVTIAKGNKIGENGVTADTQVKYGQNLVTYSGQSTPQINETDGSTKAATNVFDQAIIAMDQALDNITSRKSIIGSAGNRLESALNSLTNQYENLESANSLIIDADVAADASKYTQSSILQQVSTSLLTQANQAPSVALSLV